MKNADYFKYLYKKYTDNTISRAELRELLEHLKTSGKKEEVEALKTQLRTKLDTRRPKVNSAYKQNFLDNVMRQTVDAEPAPGVKSISERGDRKSSGKKYTMYWVAAVITIMAATALALYTYTIAPTETQWLTYTTSTRQKATITLSDGTTVRLNSQSTLRYPEQFNGKTREVMLEGEGFFDVVKDPSKPFTVASGELTTTVLGTSFNIRAYPDVQQTEIAVATGKVSVAKQTNQDKDRAAVVLTPGEAASYSPDQGNLIKSSVDIREYTAWKDGILLFNDKTFTEAAVLLEKWYGVKIIIESNRLDNCVIQGKFNSPSLQKVLDALQFAYKIEYTFVNGDVHISGEGCEE
ncbi:DUF4974 domain-containing protein [Fulvivirga sp. M361]|uniref:FecR family protein n=1 Tax=Fulvivirga sp. M361 TaxID=2594266 RepID=UPI00117A581E|nr:FecR domain-containing protein [Fulvivirga sp. M361]TRX61189.1 DUF4974 domain-containing protein [Fulvivirga sp. M361]